MSRYLPVAVGLMLGALWGTDILEAQGSLSTQVLRLLSRTNVWTGSNTFGGTGTSELIMADGVPTSTTNRIYRNGSNLFFNGNLVTTSATAGTVTSVGLSLPAIFSISGSPVTGSGTLTGTLATQSANLIWSGPSSGGAAAPTFRALVDDDIPNNITITGGVNTVDWAAVNKAGSSLADLATRSASALNSGLLGLGFLTDNDATSGIPLLSGGGGVPAYGALNLASATAASGLLQAASFPVLTGDLTTPGGSLATTLAASGVTPGTYGSGSVIPVITVDAKGRLTTVTTSSFTTHQLLSATHTDTLAGSVVRGDVIIGNATPAWSRLALGASGTVLRSNGTDAAWSTDGSGLTALNATNLASGSTAVLRGGTGLSAAPASGELLIGNAGAYTLASLTGTANRVSVTNGAGSITLSGPQDLATSSTPNFLRLGLGGGADATAAGRWTGQTYSVLNDQGNCGAASTINWTNGNIQKVTLNAATCALTFSNPKTGALYELHVTQDATGSRLATWPGTVKWQGGSTPTLTTTLNKIDLCQFQYDGTSYLGRCSLNY